MRYAIFLSLLSWYTYQLKAQSIMLEPFVQLKKYCKGDLFATVSVVNDPKPGFKYLWDFNQSTDHTVNIPSTLFGQSICVTRTCPCGKVTKHCFVFHPEQFEIQPIAIQSSTPASCSGVSDGTITIHNPGQLNLKWSNGLSGNQLVGLTAGSYLVYGVDARGCRSNTIEVEILEPPKPPLLEISTTPTSCPGNADGTAEVINLPMGTHIGWPGFSKSAEATSGLSAGTYIIRVSDDYGRCGMQSFSIQAPPAPLIQHSIIQPVSCYGDQDAIISLSLTSGQPPYTLQWDKDAAVDLAEYEQWQRGHLGSGYYPIKVLDAKGCQSEHRITVGQPPLLELMTEVPDFNGVTIPCSDESTATISVVASGGNGGFQFAWANTQGLLTFQGAQANLEPGQYTIRVVDSKGCSAQKSVVVNKAPPIKIQLKNRVKNTWLNISTVRASGGTGVLHISKKKLVLLLFPFKKRIEVRAIDANHCEHIQILTLKLKSKPLEFDNTPTPPLQKIRCYAK